MSHISYTTASQSFYERQRLLDQYLLFHYGKDDDLMPWKVGPRHSLHFHERCVALLDRPPDPSKARALDVGCAVGRATFELARHFGEVTGIDYSHAFIIAARALCRDGEALYQILETGDIRRTEAARIPEGIECSRVSFEQGDAHELRPGLGKFDAVVACNLLCRLRQPRLFLNQLSNLVKPGGQLLITTPNTWLEEFTARSYWIGATPETGEPLEALREELDQAFELERVEDVPFVIREHRRKFQWSVAQASVWRRRSG